MYISVIIPVYNQYESLMYTLNGFKEQSFTSFEIIIVDDGSDDFIKNLSSTEFSELTKKNVNVIHQKNEGRAVSRNVGLKHASGDLVIFNDADRIPDKKLIENYNKGAKQGKKIQIGVSLDYYGLKKEYLDRLDWVNIKKFSRSSRYFQKVVNVVDKEWKNIFEYPWLCFLVGNSCVEKSVFENVGKFDESFKDWGFEHFELAYRMFEFGYDFYLNSDALNYHIPHPRGKDYYSEKIIYNIEKLISMHPDIEYEKISDIFKHFI